ncbi:polymorphic toxin type 8 domain-containing protein [Lihuaxuella thermophila]|uniref:polymorphic toxin type 8 domain-containing protein n=1 Tax=Lihuaxuella thermophila TaxID=1173111 RepID=UPI003CC7AB3E
MKNRIVRELANDPKLSRALRGEIKRDINEIKRKSKNRHVRVRKNIRVPQGYDLHHRRGFEARKGFSYRYSVLQLRKDHKRYHKIHGYRR